MSTTTNSVCCCPVPSFDAIVDYATEMQSAQRFLEQAGIVITNRSPRPRIEPALNRVHSLQLEAPLPLPELLHHRAGEPPPDRAFTEEWPHGSD